MADIRLNNVSKCYKATSVLNGINTIIPDGSIYFLLGLNGAGKTTLLKIICGLLSFSGSVSFSEGLKPSIGAIIENPTFYDNLSAYNNLKYYAIAAGKYDEDIEFAMNQVGLDIQSKKPVKKYSLGMKQRLGIARAILNRPDVLILDEPLNGLDPAGMNEIKILIKRLNESGITIIISSHLINETSELATHYGILQDGYIISSFEACKKAQILQCIDIKWYNDEFVSTLLEKSSIYNNFKFLLSENGLIILPLNNSVGIEELYSKVSSVISSNEIIVRTLRLDEYFLLLTGGKNEQVN